MIQSARIVFCGSSINPIGGFLETDRAVGDPRRTFKFFSRAAAQDALQQHLAHQFRKVLVWNRGEWVLCKNVHDAMFLIKHQLPY